MFKLLEKLKNRKAENAAITPIIKKHPMAEDKHTKNILDMLNIECPDIESVACTFEAFDSTVGKSMVMIQKNFVPDKLPEDAGYSGGYYLDEQDRIFLSQKIPMVSFKTGTSTLSDATHAELVFTMAHELRHVWQRKYEKGKYYSYNATGMDVINDPSEIDADAFAMAYFFSDKTPFTGNDLPNTLENIFFQSIADGGKRFRRMKELAEEYSLNYEGKLKEARSIVDLAAINRYLRLMKLNGMI
ncbi:hypothetical protein BXO88_15710 [Oribacterium sp. C9]|uniref:hypothetical protein n=1 Tax=Oribacterium sp. C9 TaxID=1943579 RepID=UPI00099021A4|nr:hypothetical protein [Oribacterium sp. C9]OON84764.1 hypothetical protein BXO88_15710 [Oribacterium sp. C9]